MLGRVLCVALLFCFLSCSPASTEEGNVLLYTMPNMDDMTCYSAIENSNVMACTDGDILPQDPNLINTVLEVTLSFFPLIELPEELRIVFIYQEYEQFQKRARARMPYLKKMDKDRVSYYLHAHTYFDPDEGAIVVECPTPMSVQTMVHELLHHVFSQMAEDDILDHPILERVANLIIESPRFKDALRENH